MRWLRDERGAIAVIVGVSLVALFGMGAIVIDTAAMFQERRELQNGADAAALAIAESCANGLPTCALGAVDGTAQTYVDANALDSTSSLDGVDLDLTDSTVTVSTSTRRPGGATSILFWFAGVLSDDHDGATIGATATAKWGAPGSIKAGPLAFEECDFTEGALNVPRKITFHGGGTGSSCAATSPSSSGQDYPGGFGYLDGLDGCFVTVQTGDFPGDTGNDPPSDGCTSDQFRDEMLGKTIPIPIFSTVANGGSNAVYTVVGFGAFVMTEYNLQPGGGGGWSYLDPSQPYTNVCGDRPTDLPQDQIGNQALGSVRCVRGYFTSFTAIDAVVGSGPGYGLKTFSLID